MKALCLAVVLSIAAFASDVQERSTETKTFSNSQLLLVDTINGSIEATGYSGSELKVEVSKRIEAETPGRLEAAKREVKLDMTQSGDMVKLYVDGPFRCHCGGDCCGGGEHHPGYQVYYDFKLQVPSAMRVDLYTVNDGHITVRGITGDFDIKSVNGRIDLSDMGGSGRAHTVNGPVTATFVRNPTSNSSFETVNGNVDLTFRKGFRGDARMQTLNGGMYTDFEVSPLPLEPASAEKRNGKFVYRRGGATNVRIGAGGPEFRMKTLNGDIFIREAK
jgi:DUF4097 and DUF4098 domain-containing protein YvlB